jgi:hypothetical protein
MRASGFDRRSPGSHVRFDSPTTGAREARTEKPVRSHLIPILLVALLVRVGELLVFYKFTAILPLTRWGSEIIATALSMHTGQGFGSPFFSNTGPTAFVAPGFVFVVAGVMSVFGTGSLASAVIVALQVLLSLATLWLVMYTARVQFGVYAANIAGILYALYPSMVVVPVKIGDATVSTLFVAAFFAAASTLYVARWKFVPAGVACAVAALVNPALIPTLWAICGWAAWKVKRVPWLGMLAFVVMFSPWPLRNAVAMHAFIPLRSDFGYELNIGNHAGADGNFVQSMNPMMDAAEREDFIAKGEVRYLSEKSALAHAYILSHKTRFIELCFKRFVQFWAGIEEDGPPTTIPLLIFAAGGLFLLRKQKSLLALYAIPLIVYPIPYYITHVYMRFQYMIDPILTLLGAAAISALLARPEQKTTNEIGPVVSGAAD